MALPTRNIVKLILVARESRTVRAAARATHAVTIHTELFPGTPMTPSAPHRVEPGLMSVFAAAFARRDPVSRVRTSHAVPGGNVP